MKLAILFRFQNNARNIRYVFKDRTTKQTDQQTNKQKQTNGQTNVSHEPSVGASHGLPSRPSLATAWASQRITFSVSHSGQVPKWEREVFFGPAPCFFLVVVVGGLFIGKFARAFEFFTSRVLQEKDGKRSVVHWFSCRMHYENKDVCVCVNS